MKVFQTRRQLENSLQPINISLLSKIEPKRFEEASRDENKVDAMNEELD